MNQEQFKSGESRDSSLDSQSSFRSFINRNRGRGKSRISVDPNARPVTPNSTQVENMNSPRDRLRGITEKLSSHLSSPTLDPVIHNHFQTQNNKKRSTTSASSSTITSPDKERIKQSKKKFRSIITGLPSHSSPAINQHVSLVENANTFGITRDATSSPNSSPIVDSPNMNTIQSSRQQTPIENSLDKSLNYWKSDGHKKNFTYSQHYLAPFLVIMESEVNGRNLGRYVNSDR